MDPGFSVFLGGLILAAFWIGGNLREGLWGLLTMGAVGALFLFGSRGETLRGLGGPGRDERWAMIDLLGAVAGVAYIAAVAWGRFRS